MFGLNLKINIAFLNTIIHSIDIYKWMGVILSTYLSELFFFHLRDYQKIVNRLLQIDKSILILNDSSYMKIYV